MGELSVSLLRLGYLAFLWLFVFAALAVLRRDVYGTTITRRDPPAGPGQPRAGRRRGRVPMPAEFARGAPLAPAAGGAPGLAAGAAPIPVGGPGPARPGGGRREAAGGEVPTRLVVKTGPLRGTSLPLDRAPVVIGRSSTANLVLDDEFASGRHAQVVPRGGVWVLEDLGSTNGTFVGRERIAGPRELAAGQSIRIGNTTLEVLR
ncbi:MAG: FHA domain-containing protein [Bifidobacteriaceae bacterium]|jgi:hypothetical protein|nr:FHA domain-containing protein [Bifidobacteriaceae bacterium]